MDSNTLLGLLNGKDERDSLISRLEEFSMGYAAKSKVHSLVCSWLKETIKEHESLKQWWESKRPDGWTEEQHLANPHIGLEDAYFITKATKAAAATYRQNKLKEVGKYL